MAVFAEVGGDLRNHEYLHANWLRMERLKQASSASHDCDHEQNGRELKRRSTDFPR
jgi:hypothetical protein